MQDLPPAAGGPQEGSASKAGCQGGTITSTAFRDRNSCTLCLEKQNRISQGKRKGFANCKELQEKTEMKSSGSKRADVFAECGLHFQTQIKIKATRTPRGNKFGGSPVERWDLGSLESRGEWATVSPGSLQNPGPTSNTRPCKLAIILRPPAPTREICKFFHYLLHMLVHLRSG